MKMPMLTRDQGMTIALRHLFRQAENYPENFGTWKVNDEGLEDEWLASWVTTA